MIKNKLVLADDTVIDSSVIISCQFVDDVNSGNNLTVGDVTSGELSVTLYGADLVSEGDTFAYHIIEDDIETKIGVFTIDPGSTKTRTQISFTAHDNILKLEKNFSAWLREHQADFPMSVGDIVTQACTLSGVEFYDDSFPNSTLQVNAFYADSITCRTILSWAGQIAGRFLTTTADGQIRFAWYTENTDYCIGGNVTGITNTVPFKQGSCTPATYSTEAIARVQISQSAEDVGVIYPADAEGNCFTIEGNMLLGAMDTASITSCATSLYEQLADVTYTPLSVCIWQGISIRAGDIIRVTDALGVTYKTLVMKSVITTGGAELSSTGDASYGSSVAVANEQFKNMTGKVFEMSKSIDGLNIKAADLEGSITEINASVDGLSSSVASVQNETTDLSNSVSSLKQTSDSLSATISKIEASSEDVVSRVSTIEANERSLELQFESIKNDGVSKVTTTTGFIFDETGLNVSKSGSEMTTIISEDGMKVLKDDQEVLVANNIGVDAVNITVHKYLVIGNNSRLEDYEENRTGIFYIGG